jgi:Ca-activated chloride channel family protein
MGRHTSGDGRLRLGSRGLGTPARAGLAAVGVVVVIGAGVLVGPQEALARLPWATEPPCPSESVDVLVEPELQSVVTEILRPVDGAKLPGELCAAVNVRSQEGAETVASSAILPPDRAPQLWIPDSMVWVEQVTRWRMERGAPLALSPVVVATSRTAAEQLGWAKEAPKWNDVLRGQRPMAVPDIETQAHSLAALIALWQTLGKGPAAEQAVVNVVLAADRGEVPAPEQAFAIARSGTANSPVIPATEQAVASSNLQATNSNMIAIYPREGSPIMDYPVMKVDNGKTSPAHQAAMQIVIERLASPDAAATVRKAGFRDPSGQGGVEAAGVQDGAVRALAPPAKAEVDAMVGRIENLARPSRLLAVIDVSTSMKARLDDGTPRIALAGAAARMGAQLLPNRSAVGAWVFANKMDGELDYRELAPIGELGALVKSGQTHRAQLMSLASDVNRYLTHGGTGLYDVTIAAMREMHRTYDSRSVNAIILMTDGPNNDSNGASQEEVLAEIRRLNAGKQKVAIYTAGLGPDADFDYLRAVAEASGGFSYRIDTAGEGQTALLDGLRRSRGLGLEAP